MDTVTDTAAWQLWRLEQTRAMRGDIARTLAKYTGKSDVEIRRLLQEAGTQTLLSDDAIYKLAGLFPPSVNDSPALLNLLNAGYKQTLGTWKNLTRTTANTVTQQFEGALNRAWLQVSSGAFDYNTAIKRAVSDLAQNMKYITYPSGHRDTLEVAVRRAVLTGINQTASKLQMARAEEMGCEFVEASAHSGARTDGSRGPADHAHWQGKIYHIGGAITYQGEYYDDFEQATGYGTGEGLAGWNCRHNFFVFWPGVSVLNYTPERLEELNAKNIEYRGKKYSKYEISQMQRTLERNVRSAKRKYIAADAAGVDITQSSVQLGKARKELKAFIQNTSSLKDSTKESVYGFGHSQSSKAVAAIRKAEKNADFIENDASIKAASNLPKIVFGADSVLPQTANVSFDVLQSVVPKGSQTTNVYTMAGKGTSTPIRDLRRLIEMYPDYGSAAGWEKVSAVVTTDNYRYTVHWYGNGENVPPAEIKTKGVKKL